MHSGALHGVDEEGLQGEENLSCNNEGPAFGS